MLPNPQLVSLLCLLRTVVAVVTMGTTSVAVAADISWTSGTITGDSVISDRGMLIEACNFGNAEASSPSINGVLFEAVDFTSGESPSQLDGLTYNTGESGKLPGRGANELADSIAYRSGVDPQAATLVGLTVGTAYEVQFFYYHDTVNRSVTIQDGNGNGVTLVETGEPLFATGSFTADATTQSLTFDANTGSQFLNAYQLRASTPEPPLVLGEVVISEFVASNEGGLADGDGNFPDWIEIWNSTQDAIDLGGWYLSDAPEQPDRWPLPAVELPAGAYLVVFASGQVDDLYVDQGGYAHTNFRLEKDGGYLGLMRPDGAGGLVVASEFTSYPPQQSDISYGIFGSSAPLGTGYLDALTPGARNHGQGFEGFVGDTRFNPDRGFYEAPIYVTIETPNSDSTIKYTTDGSEPTPENGLDYPGSPGIRVERTTIIRAAGFRDGFKPSNVDTHSYLFVADVVDQPATPPGFPTTWTGADYGMEGDASDLALVAGDGGLAPEEAKAVIAAALLELPSMSLAMSVDDWFSPSSGIYHNSTARGATWERACSAELIFPHSLEGETFQIDCGVRVQGNTSRNASSNPKHSLRLAFRGQYGKAKLDYPFFGEDGPAEFDTLVLRSNSQDGWVYSSARNRLGQFVRDAWARETHRRMGHASPDSNWVHLYLNGLYWGVYNPTERPDAAHGAAYYGGNKDNWDAIKNHEEVLDGDQSAYRELLALIQNDANNWSAGYRDLTDPADYAEAVAAIDVEMMIDYMIHNMYAAADDWPGNFYMGYDRSGSSGGWKFYDWDNEHGMKNPASLDRTAAHSRDRDSPTKFHHALRSNAEYRLLFADHLHRAFFNGGVLYVDPQNPAWDPANPQRNVPAALWMELGREIETALIAESARWGDYRKSPPYTVANEFQNLRDDLLENWFPTRSATVLEQFRAQGLYPEVEAPVFNQLGGNVPAGFSLTMLAPGGGTIYYTTDGTDPRIPANMETGGEVVLLDAGAVAQAIVPTASSPDPGWMDPGFAPDGWQSGTVGIGYEQVASVYDELIGLEIAGMRGVNPSAFIRIPFQIAEAATLEEIGSLTLKMKYDDGFVAYLNGVKIAEANAPPAPLVWNSVASASHADSLALEFVPFDVSAQIDLLQVGENLLAIHALNDDASSSDFLICPQLVYSDSTAVGISPDAMIYTGSTTLGSSGEIRARVLDGGEWSALSAATFTVGVAAAAQNLAISEIMYHPSGGMAHEYIELMNLSDSTPIELTGVRFSAGISFEFPVGAQILPGERLLLVEDLSAFESHYGAGHPVAGQYAGRLDNSGERLAIGAADGSVIRDFIFDDSEGWPEDADGLGYSLVLIAPMQNPDHGRPTSWRSSVEIGGTPGSTDATQFSGVADEDLDADSIPALVEYGLRSSDMSPDRSVLPETGRDGDRLTFTYTRNLAADDLEFRVESSADLIHWSSLPGEFEAEPARNLGDGRLLVTLRATEPTSSARQRFLRLRISTR